MRTAPTRPPSRPCPIALIRRQGQRRGGHPPSPGLAGAGADIVSGLELKAALRAGFPPKRIVFAGVGSRTRRSRPPWRPDRRVQRRERGRDRAPCRPGRRSRTASRSQPARQPRHRRALLTSVHLDWLRDNKFGVESPPPRASSSGAAASAEWRSSACNATSARRSARGAARPGGGGLVALTEHDGPTAFARTIDIGGGLGVNYEEGTGPDVAAFAATVVPPPARSGPDRPRSSRPFAGGPRGGPPHAHPLRQGDTTASGFDRRRRENDLLRPALYKAHHRIERCRRGAGPAAGGRGGARLRDRGPFAHGPRAGSGRARRAAGRARRRRLRRGHGLELQQRPRPAEVMIEDGQVRLIRRRETFEDLVSTEV